jgi:UDP-glucose 4-epimerase
LNTVGTVNVLEAARHRDIERVIFASTDWVYGGARSDAVDEESPFFMPGAGHIYTSTKIASEFYLHDYQTLYGLDSTILRYGIPYGPRSRVGTVMPIFVKKALNNEPLTIYGDGSQFRNFIYVEDLAEGNVAALKPVAENKTYNLEGMRPISVKEVAETIKNILQKDVEIRYETARPGDYGGKIILSRRARDELGWEPKVDFEEGMRRYVEWYRGNASFIR